LDPINGEHSKVSASGAGREGNAEGQLSVAASAKVAHHRAELLGAVELGGGVAADRETSGGS